MRKLGPFFRYKNLESNGHFNKRLTERLTKLTMFVYEQIRCEYCCLISDPLHKLVQTMELDYSNDALSYEPKHNVLDWVREIWSNTINFGLRFTMLLIVM